MPYYKRTEKRRGTATWGLYISINERGVYITDMDYEQDYEQKEDYWFLNDADADFPDPYHESLQALGPLMRQNGAADAQLTFTYDVEGTGPGEPLDYQLEDHYLHDIGRDERGTDDDPNCLHCNTQKKIPIPSTIAVDIEDEFMDEIYDTIRDTELYFEDILRIATTVTEDLI